MNKGILYIILSGLCFMVVNFFVKILGTGDGLGIFGDLQHFPAHELVLARAIVTLTISYFIIRRKKLPLFGVNRKWLFIRGLAGTIALTIFFYTLHKLPFAIAAILQYLAPIFTVILAIFLLKERVYLLQWVFIILSFLGVALISFDQLESGGSGISLFWIGMGILSAAFSALAYNAIVKLKPTDQPISIVFFFPMVALPIMTVFCFFDFTMPTGIEWLLLFIIGLFTQFAQILMTKALHEGSASVITPFQYLSAIYAFFIGYYAFDETLSAIVTIGMIIAVIGVIVNVLLRHRTA